MVAVHDLWVNWFEGEENGYGVPQFHEWRKEDGIELLDQIPLLYVDDETFDYIENELNALPKEMLDMIENETYKKENQVRKTIKYAAVVTNGKSVIVFDTLGYDIPVKKSRMIPRQERTTLEMVEGFEPLSFEIGEDRKEYHHLSLDPVYMTGLTRKERQLKQLLMMAIDQLKLADHKGEAKYWLTELRPDMYKEAKGLNHEESWDKLLACAMNGWSDAHLELCRKMVEGQPYFKTIWDGEMESVK